MFSGLEHGLQVLCNDAITASQHFFIIHSEHRKRHEYRPGPFTFKNLKDAQTDPLLSGLVGACLSDSGVVTVTSSSRCNTSLTVTHW